MALFAALASGHALASEEKVSRGQKLVGDLGCPVCHEFRGEKTTAPQEAPDLSREGEKVQPMWLFDFLRKPHPLRPWLKARMPDFRLTDREALALSEFILALRGPAGQVAEEKREGTPVQARLEEGKKLFDLFECAECHPAGGEKTEPGKESKADSLAPDLTLAASRLRPEWVLGWLKSPQVLQPGTKMPNYFYDEEGKTALIDEPEEKIHLLRDYLLTLGPRNSGTAFAEAKKKFPEVSAKEGERLVREFNCAGCHKIPGLGAGEKVGPILTWEGSRVQRAWLKNFLNSPEPLRLTLAQRMPSFRLTEAEAEPLIAYLSNLAEKNVPEKFFPDGNPPDTLVKEGKRLLAEELGCLTCHRIEEQGAFGAPILTHAGKRLKAGWIYKWIQDPKHFEPQTPMPRVALSDEEARAITAYLSSLR